MNQPQCAAVFPKPRAGQPVEVRSVMERIVAVQENMQHVMAGLTSLAAGTEQDVRRLAAAVDELSRVQKSLGEAQHQTEERLNALIAVVDGMVRERKTKR